MHGSERETKRKRLLLATKRAYILTVTGVTEMRERGLLWWWWFLLLLLVVFCLVVVVVFCCFFVFVLGGGGARARANDTKAMLIMCKRERKERVRDSFADEDVQNKHHLCHVQDVQTILLLHVHIL